MKNGYRYINRRQGIDVFREITPNGVIEHDAHGMSRTSGDKTAAKPKDIVQRTYDAYYAIECQHGSRWPSSYSKNEIKRIWAKPHRDVRVEE